MQEKFKNNLVAGMDPRTAFEEAGYKSRGYTASAAITRLLKHVKIKRLVAEARERAAFKAEVTQERILKEEACLAFSKVGSVFELKTETLIKPSELPEDVQRAISAIEVIETAIGDNKTVKYKYKFWDKGRSLERLERQLGMFEKDNAQLVTPLTKLYERIADNTRTVPGDGEKSQVAPLAIE
jgi:hypothetical protein